MIRRTHSSTLNVTRFPDTTVVESFYTGGAVLGDRGWSALLPQRDLGVAILWNGESSQPAGLLPAILGRAIGLPAHHWLDVDPFPDVLYAEDDQRSRPSLPHADNAGGAQTSSANANPR